MLTLSPAELTLIADLLVLTCVETFVVVAAVTALDEIPDLLVLILEILMLMDEVLLEIAVWLTVMLAVFPLMDEVLIDMLREIWLLLTLMLEILVIMLAWFLLMF